ncbi:hypothetical protein N7G274_000589 [Stereocaulon virgatum]|uniref:Protein kinase domain-containing protein n=1 Tax=Stereocaulon virgatum TaxID=373712 RepID=A0ABR4AUW2_9LECA
MACCPLGDLSKYIPAGEITEKGAEQITRDLLEALTIIHEEGFTHRYQTTGSFSLPSSIRTLLYPFNPLTSKNADVSSECVRHEHFTTLVGENCRLYYQQADR